MIQLFRVAFIIIFCRFICGVFSLLMVIFVFRWRLLRLSLWLFCYRSAHRRLSIYFKLQNNFFLLPWISSLVSIRFSGFFNVFLILFLLLSLYLFSFFSFALNSVHIWDDLDCICLRMWHENFLAFLRIIFLWI